MHTCTLANLWNIEWFVVAAGLALTGFSLSQPCQTQAASKMMSGATTLGLLSLLLIPLDHGSVWLLKLCVASYLLVHLYSNLQE